MELFSYFHIWVNLWPFLNVLNLCCVTCVTFSWKVLQYIWVDIYPNWLEGRDAHTCLEKSQTQRLGLDGGLDVWAACLQGKGVFSFQRVFPPWVWIIRVDCQFSDPNQWWLLTIANYKGEPSHTLSYLAAGSHPAVPLKKHSQGLQLRGHNIEFFL